MIKPTIRCVTFCTALLFGAALLSILGCPGADIGDTYRSINRALSGAGSSDYVYVYFGQLADGRVVLGRETDRNQDCLSGWSWLATFACALLVIVAFRSESRINPKLSVEESKTDCPSNVIAFVKRPTCDPSRPILMD